MCLRIRTMKSDMQRELKGFYFISYIMHPVRNVYERTRVGVVCARCSTVLNILLTRLLKFSIHKCSK